MVNVQKSNSWWRKRPKDQFLSSMSMWNWPQCVQEAHPWRPLPPLQPTPPSKGEVCHCRLPPSQSLMDMLTGICPGRWKNASSKGSNGKWVPEASSCEEAEEEARWMLNWPTEGQSVSAIHQGHQREDQQSMQATWCTAGLYFQEYVQEIPHESKRKTRDDGREEHCVLNSLCWMLSNLCWRDQEDVESLYGLAQNGGQEQES